MSKQIPEILYKYRPFDGRAISMLANNQIYFSSPLDFNDPFDCATHEHMFENHNPESVKLLAHLHSLPPEAITKENTEKLIAAVKESPEMKQLCTEMDILFKEYIENIGVVSLSACNDSILMWSHYANYHKGFSIGFKWEFER